MKKGILIISFIILLIAQIASANIIINEFESQIYNKGEDLSISGTILRDSSINEGSLKFKLICGALEFELPTLNIILKEGKTKEFSTAPFMIPSAAEGDCSVEVSLFDNAELVEETNSGSFSISSELKAENEDFQINPTQVQLGKTLMLYGYITNINDEPVTGLATIYFKNEEKDYYVNNVDVSKGKLEYSYTATDNKPGEYSINVWVTDIYGNKKLFEDVASFNIVDKVHIFVEPLQKKVLPGTAITLSGEVNTVLGEKVEEGIIQIFLGEEIFSASIKDGVFNYDLELPEKISTGKHALLFSFIDEVSGNRGDAERAIYVEAIPTKLKADTYKESVKPEDVMEAIVYIYDQANELIEDKVNIELINSNGKSIYLDSVSSGKKFNIEIPQYSIPGSWMLKASYSGLEAEKEVIIEEVKDVEIEVINSTLYVKNTGNVDYKEPVSLDFGEGDFQLTKKVFVTPGETLTIDLTEEAPSGQYDVKITGAAITANTFSDILIEGKSKRSLDFVYSSLLVLVIAAMAYLTIFKKRHFTNINARKKRDSLYAKQQLKKLRELKESKPKPRFRREQSVSEFKERILKDIRDTESKMKSSKPYKSTGEKKKEDLPGGMFNMFN